MERKLIATKFLEAVHALRDRDGKDYKLLGDSPFVDLELDFKFTRLWLRYQSASPSWMSATRP